MARLMVKDTVRFHEFSLTTMRILNGLYRVAQLVTVPELWITSANDSTHGPTSRHYVNEAIDVRVHNFADETARQTLVAQIKAEMGSHFTVLYEDPGTPNAHIHVQACKGTKYTGSAT